MKDNMKKLILPIIKNCSLEAKCLSMDEYLKFVEFNFKYTFNRKARNHWHRISAVNVPFVLK